MRTPLCCLQHSHMYQEMRELSLLPTTDSLNRRGKEQLKKATEHQQCLKCPAWGGVVFKLFPVAFVSFPLLHSVFLITHWKSTWPVFLRALRIPGQKNLANTSLYWVFILFYETFFLFQSRVVKVGVSFFSIILNKALPVLRTSLGCKHCIAFSRK